jgi:L-2-hydroxyglutarate oxidase
VKQLIYPIPDPDLPFFGTHLTRMINGFVTVGPIVCRAGSARVAGLLISAHAVCTSARLQHPRYRSASTSATKSQMYKILLQPPAARYGIVPATSVASMAMKWLSVPS